MNPILYIGISNEKCRKKWMLIFFLKKNKSPFKK